MNRKQKTALMMSINHWKRNLARAEEGLEIAIGSRDCECCNEFLNYSMDIVCVKCPIAEYAKIAECRNTPYYEVIETLQEDQWENTEQSRKEHLKSIEKEIKFLEKVLKHNG
jgi:hypothetical protein